MHTCRANDAPNDHQAEPMPIKGARRTSKQQRKKVITLKPTAKVALKAPSNDRSQGGSDRSKYCTRRVTPSFVVITIFQHVANLGLWKNFQHHSNDGVACLYHSVYNAEAALTLASVAPRILRQLVSRETEMSKNASINSTLMFTYFYACVLIVDH